MAVELFADVLCWEFKQQFPDEFASYGCGPGGIGDFLVPDVVPFVVFPFGRINIRNACRIHDWGYRHSEPSSERERKRHDNIFVNNAKRIVDVEIMELNWPYKNSNRWKGYCYGRINLYWEVIRIAGSRAYWAERNNPEEMQLV